MSKAIIDVVSAAEHELPVKEIHAGVEARLGSTVSRFSVSDYLLTRSKGSKPLFERTRHGHYRTYRPGSAEEE